MAKSKKFLRQPKFKIGDRVRIRREVTVGMIPGLLNPNGVVKDNVGKRGVIRYCVEFDDRRASVIVNEYDLAPAPPGELPSPEGQR
jgi:hypothetical protein